VAVNTYRAASYSSGMPARALGTIRTNHFVIDDPAEPPYDGPGEAPTNLPSAFPIWRVVAENNNQAGRARGKN